MKISEARKLDLISASKSLPDYEARFVIDLLELFLRLEESFLKLNIRDDSLEEALKFKGFNREKEADYFNYTDFLLAEDEFKDLDYLQLDSELEMVNLYSNLLKKEEDVNISCREEGREELSLVEIKYIVE